MKKIKMNLFTVQSVNDFDYRILNLTLAISNSIFICIDIGKIQDYPEIS